jgi:hypothetical protein
VISAIRLDYHSQTGQSPACDEASADDPPPRARLARPEAERGRGAVISLLLAVALVAAVCAVAARRLRRARLERRAQNLPGAGADNAIYVRSFAEMDDHLRRRWCVCGGMLESLGEGTREQGGRRFRVARLRCQECESEYEVFFDTTDLLQ